MKRVLCRRAACTAAVIALFNLKAFAETPQLTLDQALRIFRASAFDLLIADAAIESARADVTIAAAVPNPSLSISSGASSTYDPSLCAGCSNRSVSAGISDGAISDVISGRRRLRESFARAGLDVARASRADVERMLELMLKQQFLQAELARKSFAFAREAEALSTAAFELTQTRYRAGAISEADVARADVQRLEAKQAVDAAAQAFDAARSQVAFLLGMKGARPEAIEVADDLTRTAPLSVTREDLRRQALDRRPDLAEARSQIARVQSSIDLARRQRIPDFSPSLQYSREGRGQSAIQPPTVTFGVTASLPVFYRYRGEIAKAEADLVAQEAARSKIEAQVDADVNASFAAFTAARTRADRMQSQLLSQAARARDLVRLQYEKGSASLFEFLDAQRTFLATQNEFLQNLNDYWSAVFQLEQATGMEFRQ